MCKWYKEMSCFLIVPKQPESIFKTDKIVQRAKLEQSFRNYAAVFENVKLVLTHSQAKEHYLNFPHICCTDNSDPTSYLSRLINYTVSEAVFIGHTDIGDFPISILANLLKAYNGELFMGYKSNNQQFNQKQFGIYHKNLISTITDSKEEIELDSLDKNRCRLLPFPKTVDFFF